MNTTHQALAHHRPADRKADGPWWWRILNTIDGMHGGALVVDETHDTSLLHHADGDATTLREWRRRFELARTRVLALGYDERFIRLWRFCLCYGQGGFLERSIGDVQMLFARPGYRRTPSYGTTT